MATMTAAEKEEYKRKRAERKAELQAEAQKKVQERNEAYANMSASEQKQYVTQKTQESKQKAATAYSADTYQKVKEENLAQQEAVKKATAGKDSPSQYKRAYETVKFDGNYGQFKNDRSAYAYASRLVDDKQRDAFLTGYTKYTGQNKDISVLRAEANTAFGQSIYTSARKQEMKLDELGTLYDVNGLRINLNTASMPTIVQGIRSIADSKKRNAAIATLEKLTKDKGSRFYGQSVDKELLKTYLGSPDFTQDDYDDFVEAYTDSFYPQSGYDEENAAQYWDFYDQIDEEEVSESVKRQYREALEEAWRNSTGKPLPSRSAQKEAEAEELEPVDTGVNTDGILDKVFNAINAWSEKVGEKFSNPDNAWDPNNPVQNGGTQDSGGGIIEDLKRPYIEKTEEEAEVPKGERALPAFMREPEAEEPTPPPKGWLKNDGLPDMSNTTRLASAGRSDSTSPIPRQKEKEVQGPVQRFTSKTYVKDDSDVVRAIRRGYYSELDKADTMLVDEMMKYGTVRQIVGTVTDAGAVADVLGNNRGAENVVRESYGMLGKTAAMVIEAIMGDEFPEELENDALLVLMQQAERAELMEENGVLGGDESMPLLERLLTTDKKAQDAIAGIYAARDELEAQQAQLREQEELETQKLLAEAREAVRRGEYSDEQLALVQKYAPEVKLSDMAMDYRRAELGGLIDDPDYGFFAEYSLDEDGNIQFADGTVKAAGDYIRFKDTAVYKNLEANGVIDTVDYRAALNTQMHRVIDADTRYAMSLGLTLQEYYDRIGGMTEADICQRAATRIAQQGATMTEEDMQNIAEFGDGVNALEFGSAVGGKATVGLFADFADTLYIGMSEADTVRTAGRMQVEYQNEFGSLLGREFYRRDLERLIDSGTIPESMAKSLRMAMSAASDIYQVGIDPEALGGLRTAGSKARAVVKQLDRFMQENATEGQYEWYNLTAGALRNLEQATIAMGVGAIAGAAGATAIVANSIGFIAGYSIPTWKGYYDDAVLNKNLSGKSAAYIASAKTGVDYYFNIGTYGKIAGQISRKAGLDSLTTKWAEKLVSNAPVAVTKAYAAVKDYVNSHALAKGAATFAGNILSEFGDEFGEGVGENYVDNALVPIFEKAESGAKVTASDVMKAVLVLPSLDLAGAASDVLASAKEIAITSSLFALGGAFGEGLNTYNSTRAAHDVLTGKSNDIEAVIEAVAEDIEDPTFCEQIDAIAEQAREDEAVAIELMTDDGTDGLMEREAAATEQAEAHAEKKEAAAAGMEQAAQTMEAAQAKIDSGTADAADEQMLTDAQEALPKDKTSYEEAEREELAKREEAKRLRTEKYRSAKTAAKTRLAQQDADIAANMVATMEQRKAQTEAAQLERERSNVVALEAENFVNDRYSGASEEDQQAARDAYIESAGNKVDEDFKMVDATVRQFQKKFRNINFKIVDTLGGEPEGAYERDTNTVYIARDATQGEIVKRVLIHELTHASELGGEIYNKLRDALFAFKYGDDKNRLEKDIVSKQNRYNDFYLAKKTIDENTGKIKTMTKEEAVVELVAEINSEILSGNEEMVKRLVSEQPSAARRIWETIKDFLQKVGVMKDTQIDQLHRVEKMFEKALNEAQTQKRAFFSDNIQYSLREKQPPKNVVYAYKAFYARDGKLYPPMVANITDESDKQKVKNATSGTMKSLPTPVGVWLDADIGGIMTDENGEPVRAKDTKRLRVKNDKSGGSATLAFRPGWHLGEWPDAKQFNKADPETGERGKRMPDDLVFAKCEVSADIDYQLDALSYGINEKGGFSRSQAGLPEIPEDGYYKYRTNVDPTTAPWLIAGSIKVTEILDDDDCARICAEYGVTPDKRVSGEKIDLAKFGLKRGPVEETTEGMEKFKENDANRANKELLNRALSDPNYSNAYVQREIDFDNSAQYEQLQKEFAMNGQDIEQYRKLYETRGFASERRAQPIAESPETGEPLVGQIKGTAIQYSLKSWDDKEKNAVRASLIKSGHAAVDVERWMSDVDSVARVIADNKSRLDYEAADNQVMLKDNQEYVKTLDASTLCAKRLLYQGTFNAIQHAMPDHVFTSEELLDLLNLMKEEGYETPCGVCYVESRRRHLGKFADQWLHGRPATKDQKAWVPYDGDYIPTLDELTTTDGLEKLRTEHPEAYDSFIKRMNSLGSGNPKVVQLRTDYRGDVRKMTKSQIEKVIRIGGLRVQSFSDFETPHLIDMMQAVLDMHAKGLTSQAYTKVPNFAWVFGDTGIKINLSLMAEGSGVDENGNLVFSSSEGMDIKDALALRDRYSKNVGTIIVGANDAHIRAAMADPRIDYIIPFHKSGWGENELRKVNVLQTYEDYESEQNERIITGYNKNGSPKYGRPEGGNFYPIDYWDYSKSGDENAATYLRMCEEDGRVPKFERFLTKDAEGHWVAPDGYWKMLTDFKMYDNDGNGSPQTVVEPQFNMDEAMRILDEYKGGANELPVADDIVQKFTDRYKGMQFSLKESVEPDILKQYNRFGWIRANDILSDPEWTNVTSALNNHKELNAVFGKNKDGALIVQTWDRDNNLGIIAITDEDPVYPTVERVYRLNAKDEPEAAKKMEEVILKYERRWGYDAFGLIEPFVRDGGFVAYNAQDYRAYKQDGIPSGWREAYEKNHRENQRLQNGTGNRKGSGRNGNVKLSLPTSDNLRAEMQAYHALQTQTEPEAEQAREIPRQPQGPMGERQFTTKTLQESQAVPQWIKDTLYNDPNVRLYEKDTNDAQIVRSMNRLEAEGYEAMRDRVLSGSAQNADDVADANLILAVANREGDVQTFLDVAAHYAAEGTREAKALQARKIFSRMTPTGMKVWAAGQREGELAKFIMEHQPVKRKVDAEAKRVAKRIEHLQGGDELLRLQAASEYTVTNENNRLGVPINEKQKALIREYGLENVARPGDNYNRATLKQRMLEAILAEPNPENVTGGGLNLIQRLEYAKANAPVIFNSDLDYMGRQMVIYANSPVDDQNGRIGDLALARLYEAYGNITPVGLGEKVRTWRYTATLLSLPSALRNGIGNLAQGSANAVAHGVARGLDAMISGATGERTVAGLTAKERADGWRAFRDETVNTFRDFYVDKAVTSRGEERFNMNQRGRVYQSDALEALRLTESFLMSVGDRNFWKRAYVNSIAEQQRVAEMNGVEFDYEAAIERAEAEANYATFNESSVMKDALAWIKNPGEDASVWHHAAAYVLDYLMPFTGVTTNVTKRMLEYSPAGIVATAVKHGYRKAKGKNFDQYTFVNEMARGLTGTAMLGIGALLFKAGLLHLGTGEEEDKKIYGAETAQGKQYSPYIRIGDQYIALSTFMPASSALIMGATAASIFADDEGAFNAIKNACFSSVDMIFDASYMSTLSDILNGYGSIGENTVDALLNSTVSMNVPAILGQVASAMDPYVRDTKDKNAIMQALKAGLISKLPYLREQLLEAKVDITGEKIRNSKYRVAPIDPFTRTYANDDPVLQELIDLSKKTGSSAGIPELFVKSNKYDVSITKTQAKALRINRGKGADGKTSYQALTLSVTDEEKWQLNEDYGKLVFSKLEKLMSGSKWKRADEDERVDMAKDEIAAAKLEILEEFVDKRGIK